MKVLKSISFEDLPKDFEGSIVLSNSFDCYCDEDGNEVDELFIDFDLFKVEEKHYFKLYDGYYFKSELFLVNDLETVMELFNDDNIISFDTDDFGTFTLSRDYLFNKISELKNRSVKLDYDYKLFPQQIDVADLLSFVLKNSSCVKEIRELLITNLPEIKDCLRGNYSNTRTLGYVKSFADALGLKENSEDFLTVIKALVKQKKIITENNLNKFTYSSKTRRRADTRRTELAIKVFDDFLPIMEEANKCLIKKFDVSKYINNCDELVKVVKDYSNGCENSKNILSSFFSGSDLYEMTKNPKRIESFTKEVFLGRLLKQNNFNVRDANNRSNGGVDFFINKNNNSYNLSYKAEDKFIVKNGGYMFITNGKIWDCSKSFVDLGNVWRNSSGKDKNLTNSKYKSYIDNIVFSFNNESNEDKKNYLFYLTNLLKDIRTYIIIGHKGTRGNLLVDKFICSMSLNEVQEKYKFKNIGIKDYSCCNSGITFNCFVEVIEKDSKKKIVKDFKFPLRNKNGDKGKSLSVCPTKSHLKNVLALFDISSVSLGSGDIVETLKEELVI